MTKFKHSLGISGQMQQKEADFSRVKEMMHFRLDEVGDKAVRHDKLGGKAGIERGETSTSKLQSKLVQVRCLITLNEMGK